MVSSALNACGAGVVCASGPPKGALCAETGAGACAAAFVPITGSGAAAAAVEFVPDKGVAAVFAPVNGGGAELEPDRGGGATAVGAAKAVAACAGPAVLVLAGEACGLERGSPDCADDTPAPPAPGAGFSAPESSWPVWLVSSDGDAAGPARGPVEPSERSEEMAGSRVFGAAASVSKPAVSASGEALRSSACLASRGLPSAECRASRDTASAFVALDRASSTGRSWPWSRRFSARTASAFAS